ncbi:Uncharacterised protein [Citrobacter freundii]|nr:Uncharacterised protein [Citrobacter freundii]
MPVSFADHLFSVVGSVVLAFVIDQFDVTRLRIEFQFSAAQWVGQQETIAILTGLLPEKAGIHFLLIGNIGKRTARLILVQGAYFLLVLAPLRGIGAFAGTFRRVEGTGTKNQGRKGSRRIRRKSGRVIMMTNP